MKYEEDEKAIIHPHVVLDVVISEALVQTKTDAIQALDSPSLGRLTRYIAFTV